MTPDTCYPVEPDERYPHDTWTCDTCHQHVGWYLWADHGTAGRGWTPCSLTDDDTYLCDDCAPT